MLTAWRIFPCSASSCGDDTFITGAFGSRAFFPGACPLRNPAARSTAAASASFFTFGILISREFDKR